MLSYFVSRIFFGSLVLAKVWFVSGDKEAGVQLEEVVVALPHGPGEGPVGDADGVEVGTQARGGGHGVLGIGDRHVDWNSGHET